MEFFSKRNDKIQWLANNEYDLSAFLKRNGFSVFEQEKDFSKLLVAFPPKLCATIPIGQLPFEAMEGFFYSLMSSEAKRGLFKRICEKKILNQEDIAKAFFQQDMTKKEEFAKNMLTLGAIKNDSRGNFICSDSCEFGANLEWYICQLLRKELLYISDWQVKIDGAPYGGDYDVLAYNGDKLVYVECKGKPPKNITEEELICFLKRDYYLSPYLTVLLVDTSDNLDCLITKLDNLIERTNSSSKKFTIKRNDSNSFFQKDSGDIFHICDRLFIFNTKNNLTGKFKYCFRHKFRLGVEESPWIGMFWAHKLFWEEGKDEL